MISSYQLPTGKHLSWVGDKGEYMFTCAMCHKEKDGKKYVYANSTRTVKILVCKECHAKTVASIQARASEIVSSEMVTGVLRPNDEVRGAGANKFVVDEDNSMEK